MFLPMLLILAGVVGGGLLGYGAYLHVRKLRALEGELRQLRAPLEAEKKAPPPMPSRALDVARGAPVELRRSIVDPWADAHVRGQITQRIDRLQRERADGFVNELTGIGHWLRDKTFGGKQTGLDFELTVLANIDAELRWRGSDVGHRVVEVIPDEMLRAGFEVSIQPEEDEAEETEEEPLEEDVPEDVPEEDPVVEPEKDGRARKRRDLFPPGGPPGAAPGAPHPMSLLPPPPPKTPGELPDIDEKGPATVEELMGQYDELEADEAFEKALRYERAFGGAVIFPVIDDGQKDLTKPLEPERIRAINGLNVFSGGFDGEVVVWSYYVDPRSPKYGKPEIYMIRNIGTPIASVPVPGSPATMQTVVGETIFWVHETRLIVFDGYPVTNRARIQMRGWGDSIFTRIDRVLQQYDQTWGSVAQLMTDWAQGVLKIEGLQQALSANPTLIVDRAVDMAMSRSVARMTVVGSNEDFKRDVANLGGISDVLAQFWLRLAAAADMPLSLLVGQVKGGLGDAGNTDLRFFYDRIAARQKKFKRKLRQLLKWMFLSKEGPTDGKEPERWNITFNSLYQPTEKEIAETRKIVADTDAVYIGQQVLTPEEVAVSRFGGSEWSMETTIDFAGRAKMAADAEKQKQERAKAMVEAAKKLPPAPGAPPAAKPGEEPTKPGEEPEDKPTPSKPLPPVSADGTILCCGPCYKLGRVAKPNHYGDCATKWEAWEKGNLPDAIVSLVMPDKRMK